MFVCPKNDFGSFSVFVHMNIFAIMFLHAENGILFLGFLRNIRKKTSLSSAGSHHQTAVHTDLKNAKNAIRMDGVFSWQAALF